MARLNLLRISHRLLWFGLLVALGYACYQQLRIDLIRRPDGDTAKARVSPGLPEERVGRVRYVFDGDTFELVVDGQAWRVRLEGIDAPEWRQPYGDAARDFLAGLCEGQQVRVRVVGRDRYDRLLGDVYCQDLWVNGRLVEAGYAWSRSRGWRVAELARLQGQAQREARGLWADPEPVSPWEYRQAHPSRSRTVPRSPAKKSASQAPIR